MWDERGLPTVYVAHPCIVWIAFLPIVRITITSASCSLGLQDRLPTAVPPSLLIGREHHLFPFLVSFARCSCPLAPPDVTPALRLIGELSSVIAPPLGIALTQVKSPFFALNVEVTQKFALIRGSSTARPHSGLHPQVTQVIGLWTYLRGSPEE